jgi:type II secretory pathway component PulF
MSTHAPATHVPSLSSILHEVKSRRFGENVANVFKCIGIFFLALILAWLAMILAAPDRIEATTKFVAAAFFYSLVIIVYSVPFCVACLPPFLLYFWTSSEVVRQRTLLSLIQTAVETGKPLQNIIRAYAAGCFFLYAYQLRRFADALDSGHSLEAAIRNNWGLFRYDIAGILRFGGDTSEMLRSIDAIAQDERNFSPLRTYNIFRIVCLCTYVIYMIPIMLFMQTKIVPQFKAIFKDFDVVIPTLTITVIAVSQLAYLVVPFVPLLFFVVIAYMILQTNVVTFRPIGFRRIFRSTDAAKFLRLFAAGVQRRLPIPAILGMYRWTVPSYYLRKKGIQIQHAIEQGGNWVDALCTSGFINNPEASLLKSAERTGNTATVLNQLAQSKERSQIRQDDLFSKLVFTLLVLLFGAAIGVYVIAMFLPLPTLITTLTAW